VITKWLFLSVCAALQQLRGLSRVTWPKNPLFIWPEKQAFRAVATMAGHEKGQSQWLT
jgi:hypothetical protein